jgi:hypothetical protein
MLAWALFLLLSPAASSPPARAQGLTAPPVLTTAYDTDAFLVPLSQAASLQELLDKHGSVRLLPGDYVPTCTTTRTGRQPPVTNCSFPPANLTVRTGQRIWGLPGAKVPGVVIEPGAQGVVLSALTFAGQPLYFPPGSGKTQACTFQRLNGPHVVFGAGSKVADCSFVGLTELGCGKYCGGRPTWHTTELSVGGIHAEAGSSVTNCKFIRSMVHAPWPLLTVRTKQWVGNTFLWTNVLGSLQSSFSATDAAELTVVGPDMETYVSVITTLAACETASCSTR